jgi:hypothetical protein
MKDEVNTRSEHSSFRIHPSYFKRGAVLTADFTGLHQGSAKKLGLKRAVFHQTLRAPKMEPVGTAEPGEQVDADLSS